MMRGHGATTSRPRVVRVVRAAVTAGAVVAAFVPVAVPAPARAQDQPSLVVAEVPDANTPTVSQDGRWVVFAGLDGDRRTVFRSDRNTGETTELSPVPAAATRGGDTIRPRLSADGCVVVAITEIPFDLFRDDDRRERWDVYRLVVPECGGQPNAWELVSISRLGTARDGVFTDSAPAISASGAIIAYVHQLEDAPEGVGTITVVDLTVPVNEDGREQEVAGMPVESPNRAFSYRGAGQPVLSGNGRHLAFIADTTASAPLPGWASGPVAGEAATAQVYVWDRQVEDRRRSVSLVSGRQGVPSELGGEHPSISEDGRFIAFVSSDRTLVPAELPPCTATCPTQVYRFDRDTDGNGVYDEAPRVDPLTIVSAVDAGQVERGVPVAGNASSWAPSLSADGSQVAFVTDATNILPSRRGGGGGPLDGDLLVAETVLGSIRRVLDDADLTGVPGAHSNPSLSRTGQVVVFDTAAVGPLSGAERTEAGQRAIAAVEATPRLSLAQIDFGSVLLNLESAELFVRVQNAGPASFEPSIVTATAPFRVTGGTCAKGILVAAGSTCLVYMTFTPTAARGYTGTLTVAGTGTDAPTVSAPIRGAAGEPVLLANPAGVDLPPAVVRGTGGRIALDITNIGFFPTQVARISIAGANPDDFEVVSQSCTNRALNPDASCAIEVEFHPIDVGYRSALVYASTSNGEYTTAFVGGLATYAPTFEVSADAVDQGAEIGIGLAGFPSNATVAIGFDDGSAPFASVTTNESGAALAVVQLPTRLRAGDRRLVASAGEDAVATVDIAVNARRVARPTAGLPGYGLG